MRLDDFDYNLPKELIAQSPISPRDHSRLLVLDKKTGAIEHSVFYGIGKYLQPGDVLVLNNSKVFPARLIGKKEETGGKLEVFLLKKLTTRSQKDLWQCLMAGHGRKEGIKVKFNKGLEGEVLKDNQDGTWQVRFNQAGPDFFETVSRIGRVPLPPYIKREKQQAVDKKTYQTVFADDAKVGSVAAPTAGLHFTPRLMRNLKKLGVQFEHVTLHVGLGTFASVKAEKIEQHKMHAEWAEVKKDVLKRLIEAKAKGRRIIAVGTTATRTLETVWQNPQIKNPKSKIQNFFGWTDIFIYPGYEFKAVDAMITNFHVPKSSLMMLVSALAQGASINKKAGLKKILKAYDEAIERKYRFYSYGDAMLIM